MRELEMNEFVCVSGAGVHMPNINNLAAAVVSGAIGGALSGIPAGIPGIIGGAIAGAAIGGAGVAMYDALEIHDSLCVEEEKLKGLAVLPTTFNIKIGVSL